MIRANIIYLPPVEFSGRFIVSGKEFVAQPQVTVVVSGRDHNTEDNHYCNFWPSNNHFVVLSERNIKKKVYQ